MSFAAGILATAGLAGTADPQPVLVELFTSEGCSSCPPADALLERLDRDQPVPGAQILVLSEHVDYWNYIGWNDPYSSHQSTVRQEQYVRRFGIEGAYTPQMVVDGKSQLVGNDARAAEAAIRTAARDPKLRVRLTPGEGRVTIEIDAASAKPRKAGVYLARADNAAASDVLRGENKGRKLRHVAVLRELRQVGSLDAQGAFRAEIPLPSQPGSRFVAFVQEPGTGHVLGAAMLPAR